MVRSFGNGVPREYITLVNPLCIALFQMLVVRATRSFSPLLAMAVGIFVAGTSMFIMGAVPSLYGAAASFFIFALAEMIYSPRYYAYVGSFAPKGQEGFYMGIALIPSGIGGLAGGILSGRLIAAYLPAVGERSPFAVWGTYAAIGAVCGVLMVAYRWVAGEPKPAVLTTTRGLSGPLVVKLLATCSRRAGLPGRGSHARWSRRDGALGGALGRDTREHGGTCRAGRERDTLLKRAVVRLRRAVRGREAVDRRLTGRASAIDASARGVFRGADRPDALRTRRQRPKRADERAERLARRAPGTGRATPGARRAAACACRTGDAGATRIPRSAGDPGRAGEPGRSRRPRRTGRASSARGARKTSTARAGCRSACRPTCSTRRLSGRASLARRAPGAGRRIRHERERVEPGDRSATNENRGKSGVGNQLDEAGASHGAEVPSRP
jgi:hypothetical protein